MWEKWKKFIEQKGTNPVTNRKKFSFFLIVLTSVTFFAFILRFGYIVVVGKIGDKSLSEKTHQLYEGSSVIKAKRGTIYDRNGNVIAEDATSYSLYAVLDKKYLGVSPTGKASSREKLYVQEKDIPKIAEIISKHTQLKKEYITSQLSLEGDRVEFGSLGKGFTLETKNKIEKELAQAEIKGIYFTEHPSRVYPNGKFSSQLIGFTQLADAEDDSKGLVGIMGIEQANNEILAGEDGLETYIKDSEQRQIAGSAEVKKKAVNGKDIYTTLDLNIGVLLEQKMDEVYEKGVNDEITTMLVEADTGNIVAASQRPTFNPETKEGLEKGAGEESVWQNLLVENPYEPGSTMKVFTLSAAIEQGIYNPNNFIKTGFFEFEDGTRIYDHVKSGNGTITYRQAFAWSSNVAMVTLEQAMQKTWPDAIKKFGFTKVTGTDLFHESAGTLPDMTNSVDAATTAYGQGISVTPFQMVQAYTSIANSGTMLEPNYISKIVDSKGKVTNSSPKVVGNPIKESTSKAVLDTMTSVVEDEVYGTGKVYGIEGYRVSAKTGTAQVYDNKTGKYDYTRHVNSVVQIAPTENPKYIMYVTMNTKDPAAATLVSKIANPVLKEALDRELK